MFDICILLGGCGMYDGSDPQETVVLLGALARRGGRAHCVAPGVAQLHVVDHRDGNEMEGQRDVLIEAARLARGKVTPLEEFEPGLADALVIPGGYGVAKNLMAGFAEPGARPRILPAVKALIVHFVDSRKPVAVVSLAKLLLEAVVEDAFTAGLRSELPDKVYVDEERRLLYTPGYLVADRLEQIIPGVEALGERVLALCEEAEE